MIQNIDRAFEGEAIWREYLKTLCYRGVCDFFCQLDVIAKIQGQYYLFEIKNQDIYEPPPFYGHGLPIWQINHRMKIQKELGIVAVLVVVDKKNESIFYGRLDELEKTEYIDTKGKHPRRIYNIEQFKKHDLKKAS